MKSFSQTLLAIAALSFSLTGCSKNDDKPSDPQPDPVQKKWAKKIIAGPNDYFSYSYTDQKHVKNYELKWTFSPDGPVIHTYFVNYVHEGGKVKEATSSGGMKRVYTYQNNRVVKSSYYYPNGEKYAEHDFTYNNNNQLIEVVETIIQPVDVTHIKTQLFYAENGNLSKRLNSHKLKNANQFELTSTFFMDEYDNKIHPIPGDILGDYLPGLSLFKNNPKKIRDVLSNGSVRQITHMDYEYDNQGYPVKQIQHLEINGDHKPAITYTYEY